MRLATCPHRTAAPPSLPQAGAEESWKARFPALQQQQHRQGQELEAEEPEGEEEMRHHGQQKQQVGRVRGVEGHGAGCKPFTGGQGARIASGNTSCPTPGFAQAEVASLAAALPPGSPASPRAPCASPGCELADPERAAEHDFRTVEGLRVALPDALVRGAGEGRHAHSCTPAPSRTVSIWFLSVASPSPPPAWRIHPLLQDHANPGHPNTAFMRFAAGKELECETLWRKLEVRCGTGTTARCCFYR